MWTLDKPTHPVARWESSNASHDLPALELLNSQHSLEISLVCQRRFVELNYSQNSSSSFLSKVVIARKSPARTSLFKAVNFHWSNDRKRAKKSQPHACADVFQLCRSGINSAERGGNSYCSVYRWLDTNVQLMQERNLLEFIQRLAQCALVSVDIGTPRFQRLPLFIYIRPLSCNINR